MKYCNRYETNIKVFVATKGIIQDEQNDSMVLFLLLTPQIPATIKSYFHASIYQPEFRVNNRVEESTAWKKMMTGTFTQNV